MPSTPRTGIETGILAGRLTFSKANYEYLIIPKRDDVDAFVTTPPPEILSEAYVVNTRAMIKLLKHLYHVEFRWRIYYTEENNVLFKGFITSHKKIELNHDNPIDSLKEIEPNIEYFPFEEPPIINEDFLISLARSTGAGVGLPKRFHSIAIATHVDNGNKTPILLNLAEAFLWMQENPGKLRGIALLKSYKYAILFAEPITKQELMEDVLDRLNLSVQTFKNTYMRSTSAFEKEE